MKDKALQFIRGTASGKASFCLGLGIILLLAFIPSFAQAAWWNPADWGDDIKDALIRVIVTVVTFVPAFIFFVIAGLTNWIIHIVISVSVVPGVEGTPSFVETGWQLTRNLVNALFILILVFIGLATILRIQNYQLQRTLPMLIIMALLVNFSGVFVGFIVDMGNIVSNFFLSAVGQFGSQTFGNVFDLGKTQLEGMGFAQAISYAFVMALFYLVSSFVFFIVFLLFFMRTIILWLLVILAPLAFASYILPATKSKIWTPWFEQLIQWSIIGIPIGFFLYLSNIVLHAPSNLLGAAPALSNEISFLGQFISSILSPLVGLALLFVGVIFSMQMAPTGAKTMVKLGGLAAGTAGVLAGTAAWRRMGSPLQGLGTTLRERGETTAQQKKRSDMQVNVNRLRQKAKTTQLSFAEGQRMRRDLAGITQIDNNPPGQVSKRFSAIARFGARWTGKGVEMGSRKITSAVQERDDKEMANAKTRNTNQDPNDIANRLNAAAIRRDWNGYVGAFAAASGPNGDSDEIRDMFDNGTLKKKDFATAYKHAENHGNPLYYRAFLKAFPDMIDDGTLDVRDGEKRSIWEKFDSSDIRNETMDIHSKGIFGDPTDADRPDAWKDMMQNIFLKSNSNVATEAMRHQKRYVREAVVKYAEELGQDWFIDNHREDTLTSILSAGGRTMGVSIFSGVTAKTIQERVAKVRGAETDEMLRDRRAGLELQLSEIPPARGGRPGQGAASVQTKIDEITSEFTLRDTTINPTADLVNAIKTLETTLNGLNSRPIAGLSAQDYQDIASTDRDLSRNRDEVQRRTNLGIP